MESVTRKISETRLFRALTAISRETPVTILDSCGQSNLGSMHLIAGINPKKVLNLRHDNPDETLRHFADEAIKSDRASIFTISYDFGLKLVGVPHEARTSNEPDIYCASFENLIVYDYSSETLNITGDQKNTPVLVDLILQAEDDSSGLRLNTSSKAISNFTSVDYISRIESIREEIRNGYTYQTNLTQQFQCELQQGTIPFDIFASLRFAHPAAFAAFVPRKGDTVVSISPERFLSIKGRQITSSPIKGTAKRTGIRKIDEVAKRLLQESHKNRAENTMIVDLIRNDFGRICDFGSVRVDRLCDLEEHPTLYHLVSTVSGTLKAEIGISDVLRAVFPCGSITGCPKISTMRIIEEIESKPRGLSMGAIGYVDFENNMDMSVAIRTMVIDSDGTAVFNTGGGIVIDSDPHDEYNESLLKAKALFAALGTSFL